MKTKPSKSQLPCVMFLNKAKILSVYVEVVDTVM